LDPENGYFVRRGKCEKDKSKRTKINHVSFKGILDLRLRSQEHSPVCGVSCAAFVNPNGWGIFNVADVALELDVGPIFGHFAVEVLEIGDGFVLFFQLASNPPHFLRALRVLTPLGLQSDDILGVKVSEKDVISNGLRDLVEAALESAHTTDAYVILGCAALVRVIDGVLA
jgi:hypothetical protein